MTIGLRVGAIALATAMGIIGLTGVSAENRAAATPAPTVASGAPVTAFQEDAAHDGDAAGDDLGANPKLAWHVTTDGAVEYPVVANGTVFIAFQARNGTGQPTALGQVEALDESTGHVQWSIQVPGNSPMLTWDSGTLFVGFAPVTPPNHYRVAWIDPSSGTVTRTVDLGQVGYGSIVASSGLVYFNADGYVVALDESTGAVAWSATTPANAIAVASQTLYAAESPPDSLASFNATTGKPELKPKLDGSGGAPTLTVGSGRAWLTSGPSVVASSSTGTVIRGASNTQLPALDGSLAAVDDAAPESYSFTVDVEDGASGGLLWHRVIAGVEPLDPIVDNGYVWVADKAGVVRGFDEQTGARVATIDVPDPITVDQGSAGLAATGGALFVAGDHGLWVYSGSGPDGCPVGGCTLAPAGPAAKTTAVEPSGYQQDAAGSGASPATKIAPPLATVWGRDFDGIVSYPVVADGSLDVTTTDPAGQSRLWALNQGTGDIRWGPIDLGGINSGYSPLVVDDGVIVVLSSQQSALGYSQATGQALWSRNLSQPYSQLTVAGPLVIATGSSKTLALDPSTGRIAWSNPTTFQGRPAYADGTLYLGDSTGTEALDTANNTVRWTDHVGGAYAVTDGRLVSYGPGGQAHVVDATTGAVTGTLDADVVAAAEGSQAVYEQLHDQVRAVDLNGHHIWDYKGNGMTGVIAPLYTSRCVWILDAAGTLNCLNPATGRSRWSSPIGVGLGTQAESQGTQSIATDGRRLLIVSGDRLVALAPAGQVAAHRPGPPVDVEALASDGQAAVTWDSPADNGDSPISSYIITAEPGGLTAAVPGTQTDGTVTGLSDGVSYRFGVTAVNDSGQGRASGLSVLPVIPAAGAWTVTPLQVPAGALGINADGINAGGEVVGSATWGGTNPPPAKAITWTDTTPTVVNLGSPLLGAAGTAINDQGDITASLGTNQVIDEAGQVTILRGLDSSTGLSNTDTVLGTAPDPEKGAIWSAGNITIPTNEIQASTLCPVTQANPLSIDAAGVISGVDTSCTPTVWLTPTKPTHPDGPIEGDASAVSPNGTWTAGTYAVDDPNSGNEGVFRHSAAGFERLTPPSSSAFIYGINDTGVTTGEAALGYGVAGIIGPTDGRLVVASSLIDPGQCSIFSVGAINDHNQALATADCVDGPQVLILSPPAGWTGSSATGSAATSTATATGARLSP